MNQQDQGSGPPSNTPMKRKRGRPRKEGSVVQGQGENVPVMPNPDNVLNSNQTASTTNDCDDEMVGKVVTGVIEGTFNAGYLLNVKVADTDAFLRGLVFQPGQVAPLTAENDVAPHARMIERKEIPVPVLNPQAEIHVPVPSSVQCSKQSFQSESQVPMPEEQVQHHHSGISVSLENQPTSTLIPIIISSGGIPQGTSEPGNVNQSASRISELHDKTVKQGETLHEPDISTQAKESITIAGASRASNPASEPINLFSTIENTDNELRSRQQDVPSMHQLNEVIHDEPNRSNIELNLIPISSEPEAMPSEQTSKSVDNFLEKQELPKTDVQEDTNIDLVIEKLSKCDTSNSYGRPSTEVTNIPDVGSNHALYISQPKSMPSERIGESIPSEPKFSSEGCALQEKGDLQNYGSFGPDIKFDFNEPTEPLANSMESEKQIGSGTS